MNSGEGAPQRNLPSWGNCKSNPILIGGRPGKRAPCSFFGEQKESGLRYQKSGRVSFAHHPGCCGDPLGSSGGVASIRHQEMAPRDMATGLWTDAQQVVAGAAENRFEAL